MSRKRSVQTLDHTHAHLMSDACGSHFFEVLLSLIRTVLVSLVCICLLSFLLSFLPSFSVSLRLSLCRLVLLCLFWSCFQPAVLRLSGS